MLRKVPIIVLLLLIVGGLFFALTKNESSVSGVDSSADSKEQVEDEDADGKPATNPQKENSGEKNVSSGEKQVDGDKKNLSLGLFGYESFENFLNVQVKEGKITREEADELIRNAEEKQENFDAIMRSFTKGSEKLKENLRQP